MLYDFSECDSKSPTVLAGGKGSALARLYQSGYPIPPGFVIGADSFDENGLRSELEEDAIRRFEELLVGARGVAVRSSALAEDSAMASFAGEFESVLGVCTVDEFKSAIRTVFASGRTERVKSYSESLGRNAEHSLAIVVQQMIDPDYAGVLFTVEPVAQNPNLLVGNFVQGLGERLVSGEVSAEHFTIHRTTRQYEGAEALAGFAGDLARLALEVEEEMGTPQDIEWGVKEGRVYILQARPITTLARTEIWNSSLDGDYLWSNTNVGEAAGGVLTPYTWSMMQEVFDEYYQPPAGLSMLGNIGGRVYMNVSVTLAVCCRLGFAPATILGFMGSFLGEIPGDLTVPYPRLALGTALGRLLRVMVQTLSALFRVRKHLAWAERESPRFCEEYRARARAVITGDELMQLADEIRNAGHRDFSVLLLVSNNLLTARDRLQKALEKYLPRADVETLTSGLGGDGVLESMGPMVAIEQVARGQLSREEFVRRYGHRGPEEVELAKPRTGEDPDWIDKLIGQARELDVGALLDRQAAAREGAWSRLAEKTGRVRLWWFRRLAAAAVKAARERELVRSELVRMMTIARSLAVRAGELSGLGEDIFFLEDAETAALFEGDETLKRKIPRRKATYERYRSLPTLPNVISGRIDLEEWESNPQRRTDFYDSHRRVEFGERGGIRGFPGAAGIVEGIVRVLRDHGEMHLLEKGEILVTSFTNVGWTPVFPKALAVVTDIGAPLSHAAIVARELGIPAVVGTGNATTELRTGDRVRVNGSEGTVERL